MTARVEEAAVTRTQSRTRIRKQVVENRPAPFALRCGGMLIDYIILVGIVAFSTLVARMLGGGARAAASSAETVGILISITVAVLNLGVLPGFTGRTVGKWATGLRILRTDGARPGVGHAFLRHFVGYPLSLLTLGVGFLLAALNTRGRGLHDLIADTVVVREG